MAKATTKKPKHVAIAGNIGVGKTTLTELLSKHYRWIPQFEDVDHNPYLMDFYDDMPRWSFNLQIYFLHGRLNQILEIQKVPKPSFKIELSTKMPIYLHPTYTRWV